MNNFLTGKTVSINACAVGCAEKIALELKRFAKGSQVALLCVGTEKVKGDSRGPLVGSLVCRRALAHAFVYGRLESNVTAKNLESATAFIKEAHPRCKLLIVDAALGMPEQVGTVQIVDGGLQPGTAANKNFSQIGDVGLLGVVNELSYEKDMLHIAKMNNVRVLANAIAAGIVKAFE